MNKYLSTIILLASVSTAIPYLISLDGYLTDSSGQALTGNYQLVFTLYDAETGGNKLWTETHASLTVTSGNLNALLGSVNVLNIPFDQEYWLEVQIESETLSPRYRIASSPYAYAAERSLLQPCPGNTELNTSRPCDEVLYLPNNDGAWTPCCNKTRSTPPCTGCVLYFSFDEGSGTLAQDSSGNGNDGTIQGAAWADGKFDFALSFDGSDDYVDCGSAVENSPNAITQSVWVKTASNKVILSKRHSDSTSWPTLMIENGHAVIAIDGSNHCTKIAGTTVVTDEGWHHIVGVKNGNDYFIYVDGNLENSGTDSFGISSTHNLHVAHHGAWNNYFNGFIDEVRVYNRALSQTEVAELYSAYLG